MIRVLFVAAMTLTLAGCAGSQVKSDKRTVMELADKRMTALLALDFETAYTYMSPGYRAKKSLDRFKVEFSGSANVVGFEVLDAECEENSCVVSVSRDVKINVYIPGMDRSKPINSVVQQVWVKTDGQWGYVKLK